MSDNSSFWRAIKVDTSPEIKVKSEKAIITRRFAKIRFETKGESQFAVGKREFREWSQKDTGFREAYEKYAKSGNKKDSPVIELKDKSKGYGLENMKWVCQREKSRKNGKAVKVIDTDKQELFFPSARKAELKLKLPRGVLNRALRTTGKYKKVTISFA